MKNPIASYERRLTVVCMVYTYCLTYLYLKSVMFPIIELLYTGDIISIVISISVFIIGMLIFARIQTTLVWHSIRALVWFRYRNESEDDL